MPLPTVGLTDLYGFTCPQCGAVNIVGSVLERVGVAERVQIAADAGVAPDDVDDVWEARPTRVRCSRCRTRSQVME